MGASLRARGPAVSQRKAAELETVRWGHRLRRAAAVRVRRGRLLRRTASWRSRSGRSRWRAVRTWPAPAASPPLSVDLASATRWPQLVASNGSRRGTRPGIRWPDCLAKPGRRRVDQPPSRAASRPRADASPCSLMSPALRGPAARPSCRSPALGRPRGCTDDPPVASSRQLWCGACLKPRYDPPVAHQHAGEGPSTAAASANPRPSQMA